MTDREFWDKLTQNTREKMVEIPEYEYLQYVQDSQWLSCLDAAGVDGWDGYDYAQELMDDKKEETV